MKKQLLSILLTFCMVVSVLPSAAMAAEDPSLDEVQQSDLSVQEEEFPEEETSDEEEAFDGEETSAGEQLSDGEKASEAGNISWGTGHKTGEWETIEVDGEVIGEVRLDPPVDWFEGIPDPTLSAENKYIGQVKLKNTNEERWIDRIDVPDYMLDLYDVLEEAIDGDRYNDYLIDDKYFDLSKDFESANNWNPGGYVRPESARSTYAAIVITGIEANSVTDDLVTYIYDCCWATYSAFVMDHPEMFWYSGMSVSNYRNNNDGKVYFLCVISRANENNEITLDARKEAFRPGGGWDIREQMARRDAAVENILSTIPEGADRYTQVYCINDWLVRNNQYNTLVSAGKKGPWYAQTCLSALTGSKGEDGPVCQGYAVSFKILCDALDIHCVSVRGDVWYSPTNLAGYHEWNYVQMEDGKWYIMDVTWNSPDSTGWFLIGGKTMVTGEMDALTGHPAENWYYTGDYGLWFTNGPVLSDTAYSPLLRYSGMPASLAVGDKVNLTAQLTRSVSGASYTYSVNPALPSGLTLDPYTGRITGTVTNLANAASTTVTAANRSNPKDSATYILKFPAVEASIRAITFDANGGTLSGSNTATTNSYGKLSSLPSPTRSGYTFTGWYTEGEGGTQVTKDTTFTADTTIYAHWVSNSSASSGKCGNNVTWSYNNGVLTITGSGAMSNYNNSTNLPPWYDRREQIQAITIDSGVTSIGWYAFHSCSNVRMVSIPSSVTSINSLAFYGCSSLESVTIPSGVTTIGQWAFRNCSGLKEVTIPSGVTSIEWYTFAGCTSLKSVTIPSSVTSIGKSAFYECTSLESVTIPGGVTSIEQWTFGNCTSLKSVTIPSGVTSIGSAAFYNCGSLQDVYYGGSSSQWSNVERDNYNDALAKATLRYECYLPEGADIAAVLDRSSQTVYVTLRDQTGRTVVCAAYSPQGQMTDMIVSQISAESMTLKFSKNLPENCDVKIIVVNSNTWAPLLDAYALPKA